jgi:hypothetical protein
MTWILQIALIISIKWVQREEDGRDHYDSDNSLSYEEREYRRQRDEQDAINNAPLIQARRAANRRNNQRQRRRPAPEADEIIPIYQRHDNNSPPDYDSSQSGQSTPIQITGTETWEDFTNAAHVAGLNIRQRVDALELMLVDSY